MARIVTYTIIMAGIWILLNLAGIDVGSTALLDAFGISNGLISSASALIDIKAIFALAATVGVIIIGTFTRQSVESILVAGFSTFLITMTFVDFGAIILYFFATCPSGSDCNFASWIISTIFSILWVGYLISIVQWWRGGDN